MHHLIFVFLYPLCANVLLVHTVLVYIKLNLTSEIYFIPFRNAVTVADVHSNAVDASRSLFVVATVVLRGNIFCLGVTMLLYLSFLIQQSVH